MDDVTLDDPISFLKQNLLFLNFSEQEISSIIPYLEYKTCQKGDLIIHEGDAGENLYLIQRGRAEIIREATESSSFHLLGLLESGDWVGEMAYFEKKRRSASIRAIEDMNLLVLPLGKLQALKDAEPIYVKILHQLTVRMSQRLRKTNESLIDSLKDKLLLLQSHSQISRAIVYLFIAMALYYNLSGIFNIYLREILSSDLVSAFIILFLSGFILWIIFTSGYPLDRYGIKVKNVGREIGFAVLWTLPMMLWVLTLEWLMVTFLPPLEGFSLFAHLQPSNPKLFVIGFVIYFALVPLQELIVRGFTQTSLREFFIGPHRVFLAILSSNLLFELFHTIKGIWFSVSVFGLGLFWGLLYENQRSLLGVSVSHALLAAWCFLVLNYDKVFAALP